MQKLIKIGTAVLCMNYGTTSTANALHMWNVSSNNESPTVLAEESNKKAEPQTTLATTPAPAPEIKPNEGQKDNPINNTQNGNTATQQQPSASVTPPALPSKNALIQTLNSKKQAYSDIRIHKGYVSITQKAIAKQLYVIQKMQKDIDKMTRQLYGINKKIAWLKSKPIPEQTYLQDMTQKQNKTRELLIHKVEETEKSIQQLNDTIKKLDEQYNQKIELIRKLLIIQKNDVGQMDQNSK